MEEFDCLRDKELCILAPAREPAFWRAFFVAGGRVTARTIPRGGAGRLEIESGLAGASVAELSFEPEDAADLLVVAGFLRRPLPEIRVVPLGAAEILAA